MSGEADFIASLRRIATHPAARGLIDDAAVLSPAPGRDLVLTHDMIVEGVHFLPGDPAADVAWKLVAVNLSDLAAKGAVPVGMLMGYALTGDAAWDAAFVAGLGEALTAFDVPLLGGDTVSLPRGNARVFGMTALGSVVRGGAPARRGARAGDTLWVTGTIGDAGVGLAIALGQAPHDAVLLRRYRRPEPRLAAGQALAPHVSAMADVSDGLLIDAQRMSVASGLACAIDLDAVPLSDALMAAGGARIAAVCAGDDYELLFAAPQDAPIFTICEPLGVRVTPIGCFGAGAGLTLSDRDGAVPIPSRLGYEHGFIGSDQDRTA